MVSSESIECTFVQTHEKPVPQFLVATESIKTHIDILETHDKNQEPNLIAMPETQYDTRIVH